MVGRWSTAAAMAAAILSVLVLAGCRSGPSASSALTTTRAPQPTHSEITPVNIGADTSTAPSPVPTSRPTSPPATVTVVAAHETFPDGQASLDPPATGQVPVDPTAAWNRIAARLPGNPCDPTKATTVQFGLLTFMPPQYNKVPEWVLRCIDNPAPLVMPGPGYLPGHPSPTPAAQSTPLLEDFISVFDSQTGKLLLGWNESAS